MATIITEVYDAFRSAGADEDKAKKAAEALSAYDKRFAEIDVRFERINGRLDVITWMLATLIAGVAALIVRVYA